MTQRPEATTALLMQLCTAGESENDYVAEVDNFTHLYDERCHPSPLPPTYLLIYFLYTLQDALHILSDELAAPD